VAQEASRVLRELDPAFSIRAEAEQLSAALADALPSEQEERISAYRGGQGPVYDLALAQAIPNLPPDTRARGRQALTVRLAQANVPALREGLRSPEREIRLAAVQVSGQRKVWSLVPDLIPLLTDRDATIQQQARQALRDTTDQDWGPSPGADIEERLRAVRDWRAWWKSQAAR
jgi:HEAT repeat protein